MSKPMYYILLKFIYKLYEIHLRVFALLELFLIILMFKENDFII